MPVLTSKINVKSQEFADNAAHMQAQVDDLHAKVHLIMQGGGDVANQRHVARGKLLPRDRINTLLDPGSPFLELCQLAAYEVYDDHVPAAGVIAGIGRVEGVERMIVANDASGQDST